MYRFSEMLVIAVFLIATFTLNAFGGDNLWTTNGPFGGRIQTIAIDPNESNKLYIGSVENGIYRSSDFGLNWRHLDSEVLERTQRVIRIRPDNSDIIYSATANGIFRSDDGGINWHRLNLQISECRTLEIHSENPSIIITGSAGSFYRSYDGGNSWEDFYVDLMVQSLCFDPSNSMRIYMASQSAPIGMSVFRSDDLGSTWTNIHNDLPTTAIVLSMTIDQLNPQIIYLSQVSLIDSISQCLSKTTNGGEHWFDITPPRLTKHQIYSLTVSPFNHNQLFACTKYDGVMYSSDGGITWNEKNRGLDCLETKTLVIDSLSGYLYLGTYYGGIYRSFDYGNSWEKISYNIINANCIGLSINNRDSDSLALTTLDGFYLSSNEAETWNRVNVMLPSKNSRILCAAIDTISNYIFIGLGLSQYPDYGVGGVMRSLDGGISWEVITDSSMNSISSKAIAISYDSEENRRIFLGTDFGLFYSDDLGVTWQLCQNGIPIMECSGIEVSQADNNIVFVSLFDSPNIELFRSVDRGINWIRLSNIPQGVWSRFIVCDHVNRDVVYADMGVDVGVYKSTDCGDSWNSINNNLPRDDSFFQVAGLAINPLNNQEIYLNSFGYGVYVSYNGGVSWSPFNNGLPRYCNITNIAINAMDTCQLYGASEEFSAWSYTRVPEGVADDINYTPDKFAILTSYPNPFNPTTTISFSLPHSGYVTLNIYSITGQKVATILDTYQQAGEYSIVWDASAYSSGLYLARLEAEDRIMTSKLLLLR
jgi:photosystem II stability/assembly factor-like uncharacterized protein